MSRLQVVGLVVGLLCLRLLAPAAAAPAGDTDRALLHLLDLVVADARVLVLDGQARQLRLQHGGAILRSCSLRAVHGDALRPGTPELDLRLRRYRPRAAWSRPLVGPFDWEQNLVRQATPRCALYFSNGLLVYADRAWHGGRGPAVQLDAGDLRALYDACLPGTPLVVLPPGWRTVDGGS